MDPRTTLFAAAILTPASVTADATIFVWSTPGLALGLTAGRLTRRRA